MIHWLAHILVGEFCTSEWNHAGPVLGLLYYFSTLSFWFNLFSF